MPLTHLIKNTVPISPKFKECYDIFLAEAFDRHGIANSCKIHDVFSDRKGVRSVKNHNCLGCNFEIMSNSVLNFLKKHEQLNDIYESFTIYIMLLYLIAERINTVFGILNLPKDYRDDYYKIFQQIRKWANFTKHPKAFMFTHHAIYDFEGSGVKYGFELNETIDSDFVGKFYKGASDPTKQKNINNELTSRIRNKQYILVLFPDVCKLTKEFCYSYNQFIEEIRTNENYIKTLNDETTIINYFENS